MSDLPAKRDLPRVRKFHGELSPAQYLQLEQDAFQRGVSPYKLTSQVIALYLSGRLVPVSSEVARPSPSPSVAGAGHQGSA